MAKNANATKAIANDNATAAGAIVDAAPANNGPETIVNAAAPERAPITIVTRTTESKSAKAVEIFNDCYKNFHTDPKSVPARKDIIQRLMSEAKLTANGAATYLQNMKSKAGLVAKKAA